MTKTIGIMPKKERANITSPVGTREETYLIIAIITVKTRAERILSAMPCSGSICSAGAVGGMSMLAMRVLEPSVVSRSR
ncbi:MAG TPA: hypothetical protein PLG99_10215 [Kaistiaceae bacterium]|nr:hypothetical protein [Kaistiaceae bacterium]